MNKTPIYIITGGQGCGKGTFAKKWNEQQNWEYIETGAIFRSLPADSEIGQKINKGELINDDDSFALIQSEIEKVPVGTPIILDGFPRTLPQATKLFAKYKERYDLGVLYFDVPKDVLLKRIQKRLNTSTEKRSDDADPQAVERRLNSFYLKTLPGLEYLKNETNVQFETLNIQEHFEIEQTYNLGANAMHKMQNAFQNNSNSDISHSENVAGKQIAKKLGKSRKRAYASNSATLTQMVMGTNAPKTK